MITSSYYINEELREMIIIMKSQITTKKSGKRFLCARDLENKCHTR